MSDMLVYFLNGRIARFEADRVEVCDSKPSDPEAEIEGGKVLVNWGNVCFIKCKEEAEEE